MDLLNAELVLNVLQFLNVTDASRLARTCSRTYYLVHQFRRLRGPELVAATAACSDTKTRQKTPSQVCDAAVARLQSPPNLALLFTTVLESAARLVNHLPSSLPSRAVILNATAPAIQTSLGGIDRVECKSYGSVMLMNLHDVSIVPFCFDDPNSSENCQQLSHELQLHHDHSNDHWKVFLVYACGRGAMEVENFVTRLQRNFLNATILGGVCDRGHVSLPTSRLDPTDLDDMSSLELMRLISRWTGKPQSSTSPSSLTRTQRRAELLEFAKNLLATKQYCLHDVDEDGIFGVALGGNVPVQSVVSRGVKSLMVPSPHDKLLSSTAAATMNTPFYVDQVEFHQPGDERYMFCVTEESVAPSYHVVRTVVNRDTGKVFTPRELYVAFGEPDVMGIKRPGASGYELLTPHPLSDSLNAFLFFLNENTTETQFNGANIDFFIINGDMCLRDLEDKMQILKNETANKDILGAVMFSCNARGPKAGRMIREDMADAKRFAKSFPTVPCLGFYAGGEIGPLALARCAHNHSVFQTGNATLQGFTAIFALFIVPTLDWSDMRHSELDDSPKTIKAFLTTQLRPVL